MLSNFTVNITFNGYIVFYKYMTIDSTFPLLGQLDYNFENYK